MIIRTREERPLDTTTLRELAGSGGPYASVYFEDSHDTEDAAKQLELKRRDIREQLAGKGAGDATVEAVDRAIRDGRPPIGRSGRAVLAAHGRVLLDEGLAEPPGAAEVRFSELPHLVPLLAHSAVGTPHLVVIADRAGADITSVDAKGRRQSVTRVDGEDHPVHKVRGGAEAHRDIQARVEENVHRNLDQVAERTAKLAAESGAELIVLAGEVQARRELRELLPKPAKEIATEVTAGARADSATEAQLDAAIGELLTGRRLARLDRVAERYRAELGRAPGLAVSGLEGVTTALREGNVETLLVTEPGDATVAVGEEPAQVAVSTGELAASGGGTGTERRADEALPVAALSVGAGIVVFDERLDLAEGFGAILRH
ncbi:Vms1/Ankzf1 family peptidyl-tRNA hydrolase [Amycolatopsis sp. YIM 10]|uniref:Rv2629 family ribosome hibernation factor n=1 Tax=Amycolatopsis sp. YIM 10 TaxID=2653857 RepID=UPI001D1376E4|nr:Vms1/Ankzf1 family peptidyl-tRNA hydrolase [Amycolatopsis sp. YIM 10]